MFRKGLRVGRGKRLAGFDIQKTYRTLLSKRNFWGINVFISVFHYDGYRFQLQLAPLLALCKDLIWCKPHRSTSV